MSYLKDFLKRIDKNDYHEFLKLWEEYCHSETPDAKELIQILQAAKNSFLAVSFGNHVDRAISLWKNLEEGKDKDTVLKIILDIQNTNSEELAEITYEYLKNKYSSDKYFSEKIRLIGLRSRMDFQKAISKFELLMHLAKGKYVFHTAGWGTGEILDMSLIREEMSLEFEYVIGKKSLTFEKALKTLIPLSEDHFLARRFGNPDLLEKEAKEDSVKIITLLLKDLGPKTAEEIKEEVFDLVIPEKDWGKWWQTARSKLKKSTKIAFPKNMKKPFLLREGEVSHEESLYIALEKKTDINNIIQIIYSFVRDFSETLKNEEFKKNLHLKLEELLGNEEVKAYQKLQVFFLLENIGYKKEYKEDIENLVKSLDEFSSFIDDIVVISFKKKILLLIKSLKSNWKEIFSDLFFDVKQNLLRDFIFSQLEKIPGKEKLEKKVQDLLYNPRKNPITFVWYFQKILKEEKGISTSKNMKNKIFESFMILLDFLYNKPEYKELSKRMVSILVAGRYKIVRDFMEKASFDEIKEFLLLSTKCSILSDHEKKIIRSLAEVVFPELKILRKPVKMEDDVIWTTKEGYEKIQNRMKQIATVETIENAKEIEEARALGDLRENAEYKAAMEKRSRLQGELKMLSKQVNKARILTKNDVNPDITGIGTIIECEKSNKEKVIYTILGPWDANPEENVLSFQSDVAKKISNLKIGDSFDIKGETYAVKYISSFLE